MAERTGIEWCDHTWSPWIGCTQLTPACDFCYAKEWAARFGYVEWNGPPRRTSAQYWRQLQKWELEAAASGVRPRVFPSLCDPFDNQAPESWRDDLWAGVRHTPHLLWLLLTKRPQNIPKMLPPSWGDGWPNVWLGTTAEDAARYRQRWAHLAAIPARIRFLSYEPALGRIGDLDLGRLGAPNWVIAGGESGPHARPCHPDWIRSLRDQCAAAGVPFFFKQWGQWAPHTPCAGGDLGGDVRAGRVRIVHPTGQSDLEVFDATGGHNTVPGSRDMARIGKKRAGALLDGREHREFPPP